MDERPYLLARELLFGHQFLQLFRLLKAHYGVDLAPAQALYDLIFMLQTTLKGCGRENEGERARALSFIHSAALHTPIHTPSFRASFSLALNALYSAEVMLPALSIAVPPVGAQAFGLTICSSPFSISTLMERSSGESMLRLGHRLTSINLRERM